MNKSFLETGFGLWKNCRNYENYKNISQIMITFRNHDKIPNLENLMKLWWVETLTWVDKLSEYQDQYDKLPHHSGKKGYPSKCSFEGNVTLIYHY